MPCKEDQFSEKDIPDLAGYVIIVTGGNSGIGYETTRQLALRNARVYITSRSEERVSKAIREMRESVGGKSLDLHFLQVDLQDLRSVKAAAASFMQRESRLDIIINNAGIMNAPYALTKDGFESQWQVNYLAVHFLVSGLMPLLLATAQATGTKHRVRVVNVSSDAAFMHGDKRIHFEDPNLTDVKGATALWQRYAHSKQANIRLATEINDRYSSQGVTAYSCHPGIVKTNLQKADTSFLGNVTRVLVNVAASHTPLTGSLTSLYLATSPQAPVDGQGKYFEPIAKLSKAELARTWAAEKDVNRRLYEETEQLIQKY